MEKTKTDKFDRLMLLTIKLTGLTKTEILRMLDKPVIIE